MRDKVRNEAFAAAIERNIRPGHVVLDLGCGVGLLAMLAARQGARVYALDKSNILDTALKNFNINSFKNIKPIMGDFFKTTTPEKVDFVLHEQIGTFLWDEDIAAKARQARRHWLKPQGRLIPEKIELWAAPSFLQTDMEKSLGFWKKKHLGLDWGPVAQALLKQSAARLLAPRLVDVKSEKSFLAAPQKLCQVNLGRDAAPPDSLETTFTAEKAGWVRGLCAFMRVFLDEKLHFSTAPRTVNTHWGQMFAPLAAPFRVRAGQRLCLELKPRLEPEGWRICLSNESAERSGHDNQKEKALQRTLALV